MWYCGLFTILINNVTVTYNHISSKFLECWLLFILAWMWGFSSKISACLLVLSAIFWIHSSIRNVFRIDIGLLGSSGCTFTLGADVNGNCRLVFLPSWVYWVCCVRICYSRTTSPNSVGMIALIRTLVFVSTFFYCWLCRMWS